MSSIVKAPLACIHNPAVGREAHLGVGTLELAPEARRVAVVGGGPGGLRAALVAAQRGHEVTLFEREPVLGGQVRWLARVEAYREYSGIVDWLESQLEKTSATIRRGVYAGTNDLDGFDSVIIATGSKPGDTGWSAVHPLRWGTGERVPGSDQWNVFTMEDVLGRDVDIPRSVLVVDDIGGRQGAAVAEFLADRRHPVEVVTRLNSVFPDLAASRDIGRVQGTLRRKGVTFSTDFDLVAIEEDRVYLKDVHTGEPVVREGVDAVVLVTGSKAEDSLAKELRETGVDVHVIGDALAPRRIFNAVWEGEHAGRDV